MPIAVLDTIASATAVPTQLGSTRLSLDPPVYHARMICTSTWYPVDAKVRDN